MAEQVDLDTLCIDGEGILCGREQAESLIAELRAARNQIAKLEQALTEDHCTLCIVECERDKLTVENERLRGLLAEARELLENIDCDCQFPDVTDWRGHDKGCNYYCAANWLNQNGAKE